MSFIYSLTATWNAGGTTFDGIKLNVSNGVGGSAVAAAASRILNLQNNASNVFSVDLNGLPYFGSTNVVPLIGTPLSVTGGVTISSTHNSKTLYLTGGQFTVQFPAASTLPGFSCMLVNPASETRTKTYGVNSLSYFLYPGQSVLVYSNGTTYGIIGRGAWEQSTSGILNLYVDESQGSDTNDGLASGTSAFQSIDAALYSALGFMKLTATGQQGSVSPASTQVQVVINLASNQTFSNPVHWSPHDLMGGQGGAAIMIQGGTNSILSVSGNDAVATYFGSVLQFRNLTIRSDNNGINALWGSKIYILDAVTFGGGGVTPAGAHIRAVDNAYIEFTSGDTVNIAGPAAFAIQSDQGGILVTKGATFNMTANANFTLGFVWCSGGGLIDFTNSIINTNAHAFAGPCFTLGQGGNIRTGTNIGDFAYFPGTSYVMTSGAANYDDIPCMSRVGSPSGGSNVNYQILVTDIPFLVVGSLLTAPRTWTLPLASSLPPGCLFSIADGGGINGVNTLTISAHAGDTFVGTGVAGNSYTIPAIYGSVTLRNNPAANSWTRIQ